MLGLDPIGMKKKQASRQPRKPTGKAGPFVAHTKNTGAIEGEFQRIGFPKVKAEIEAYIVDRFIFSANQELARSGDRFFLHSPQQNPQNDFDFNIMAGDEPAYLELTEIVSTAKMGHSGYPENSWSNVGSVAQEIFHQICKKSAHYMTGSMSGRPIFLLLYTTHWAFAIDEYVVTALRILCHDKPPIFSAVFSYDPLDQNEGISRFLYPVPEDLRPRHALDSINSMRLLRLPADKFQLSTNPSASEDAPSQS